MRLSKAVLLVALLGLALPAFADDEASSAHSTVETGTVVRPRPVEGMECTVFVLTLCCRYLLTSCGNRSLQGCDSALVLRQGHQVLQTFRVRRLWRERQQFQNKGRMRKTLWKAKYLSPFPIFLTLLSSLRLS